MCRDGVLAPYQKRQDSRLAFVFFGCFWSVKEPWHCLMASKQMIMMDVSQTLLGHPDMKIELNDSRHVCIYLAVPSWILRSTILVLHCVAYLFFTDHPRTQLLT